MGIMKKMQMEEMELDALKESAEELADNAESDYDADIIRKLLAEIQRLEDEIKSLRGSYRPLDMNWPT